jgi:hypothetical protein
VAGGCVRTIDNTYLLRYQCILHRDVHHGREGRLVQLLVPFSLLSEGGAFQRLWLEARAHDLNPLPNHSLKKLVRVAVGFGLMEILKTSTEKIVKILGSGTSCQSSIQCKRFAMSVAGSNSPCS